MLDLPSCCWRHPSSDNLTGMFGSDRSKHRSLPERACRVVDRLGSLTGSLVQALTESANPWSTDGLLNSLVSDLGPQPDTADGDRQFGSNITTSDGTNFSFMRTATSRRHFLIVLGQVTDVGVYNSALDHPSSGKSGASLARLPRVITIVSSRHSNCGDVDHSAPRRGLA
jgi:hypothetical protein